MAGVRISPMISCDMEILKLNFSWLSGWDLTMLSLMVTDKTSKTWLRTKSMAYLMVSPWMMLSTVTLLNNLWSWLRPNKHLALWPNKRRYGSCSTLWSWGKRQWTSWEEWRAASVLLTTRWGSRSLAKIERMRRTCLSAYGIVKEKKKIPNKADDTESYLWSSFNIKHSMKLNLAFLDSSGVG